MFIKYKTNQIKNHNIKISLLGISDAYVNPLSPILQRMSCFTKIVYRVTLSVASS